MLRKKNQASAATAEDRDIRVPGGMLRYRVSGRGIDAPWLVFESAWGISYPYLYFLERALASSARLLFYDRAGVGESRRSDFQNAELLTVQFVALLSHLQISEPVVVIGHSFGGLVAALHAAQAPHSVRAIIEIDPTPELDDARVDGNLGMAPALARILKLCARMGIPDPFFSGFATDLPAEIRRPMLRRSLRSLSSIDASLEELKLLPDIRRTIARLDLPRRHPRLVISADDAGSRQSGLLRLLVSEAKAKAMLDAMQGVHQRQAATNSASRWKALPHTHSGLVTTDSGASDVACSVLAFIR